MIGQLCMTGCCGGDIGFDTSDAKAYATQENCFHGKILVFDLANNINKLSQLKLCFAGNDNSCGTAVRFSTTDWPAVKDWLSNGGRMFMVAEHSGEVAVGIRCLQDMSRLNDFLAFLEVSIRYVGGFWPFVGAYAPGAANIAQGVSFGGNLFGELAGGTSVWTSPVGQAGAGKTIVAVERVGNGFYFLSGDSNHILGPPTCPFVRRLLDYGDDQII